MQDRIKYKLFWFSFGCLIGSLVTVVILSVWQPIDSFPRLDFFWNHAASTSKAELDTNPSSFCTYLDQVSPPWLPPEKRAVCHSSQLDIPTTLQKRVAFWKEVWGVHPDRLYLLVDQRRPWITYRWVDCRDLFKHGKANEQQENVCDLRLFAVKKKLVKQLWRHRRNPKHQFLKLFDNNRKQARTAYRHIQVVQGLKDSLAVATTLLGEYLHEVENIFQSQGAPPCLARMSIIESLADPMAVSSAGAVGAFQFVGSTARKYLLITDKVDERLDPLREGWAAACYLKTLYGDFKSWPLALTAYNTGPTRLRRLIRSRRTKDLGKLANGGRKGNFGFQSQNYYAQFVAVVELTDTLEVLLPEKVPTFMRLSKPMSLSQLASCLGSTPTQLAAVNPSLREAIVEKDQPIPKDYLVTVPQEVLLSASDNQPSS